jgi:hypothetical protein
MPPSLRHGFASHRHPTTGGHRKFSDPVDDPRPFRFPTAAKPSHHAPPGGIEHSKMAQNGAQMG